MNKIYSDIEDLIKEEVNRNFPTKNMDFINTQNEYNGFD